MSAYCLFIVSKARHKTIPIMSTQLYIGYLVGKRLLNISVCVRSVAIIAKGPQKANERKSEIKKVQM